MMPNCIGLLSHCHTQAISTGNIPENLDEAWTKTIFFTSGKSIMANKTSEQQNYFCGTFLISLGES